MKITKKILKNLVYFFYDLWSVIAKENNRAVVLMYHSVASGDLSLAVEPSMFLKQIEYLVKSGYHVVSLAALNQSLKSGNLPPRTVSLTFDDGYFDNYLSAYPILKKYNLPATIFLSSSLINKQINSRSGSKMTMLTDEVIRELIKSGLITIGSHCHNHKKLANLDSSEIKYELFESKKIMKERFNYEMDFLAYPFGSFNDSVKVEARDYYQLAFSVNKGVVSLADDRFELKRNNIDHEVSLYQFKRIVKYGRL